MTISIGIPTCNRLDLLEIALKSCLLQTYPPNEIIIGDDSCTDATRHFLENIINKNTTNIEIIYFKNSPALGQGHNVNKIIDQVSSNKFLLLHDDDILELNALQLLMGEFHKKSDIHVVYGKQVIINNNGETCLLATKKYNTINLRTESQIVKPITPINAAIVQQFPNNGFLINSECFKRVKYYLFLRREFVGNAVDFDFSLRLAMEGFVFSFINVYISSYRITQQSISTSTNNNAALMAFNIIRRLQENKDLDKKYYEDKLKYLAPAASMQAITNKQINIAIKILFCKWHCKRLLTLGGGKRIFCLSVCYFKKIILDLF